MRGHGREHGSCWLCVPTAQLGKADSVAIVTASVANSVCCTSCEKPYQTMQAMGQLHMLHVCNGGAYAHSIVSFRPEQTLWG